MNSGFRLYNTMHSQIIHVDSRRWNHHQIFDTFSHLIFSFVLILFFRFFLLLFLRNILETRSKKREINEWIISIELKIHNELNCIFCLDYHIYYSFIIEMKRAIQSYTIHTNRIILTEKFKFIDNNSTVWLNKNLLFTNNTQINILVEILNHKNSTPAVAAFYTKLLYVNN